MPADPLRTAERLAAVARSGLLDTEPEESFDRLAALARQVLATRYAFITVVDDERAYWKARLGTVPGDPVQTTAEESLCRHVVRSGEALVSGDLRRDPLTADDPTADRMGLLAWAGYPVHAPDGQVIGSLCVADTVARTWSDDDRRVMDTLARVVSAEVALRVTAAEARAALDQARAAQRRVQLLAASGELLRAGLDLDSVLAAVTRTAVPALGQAAVVFTADRHGAITARASSLHHEDPAWQARLSDHVAGLSPSLDDAVGVGHVLRTGQAQLVLVDPDRGGADGAGRADALRVTGALCVPLRAHGRVFGELQVLSQSEVPYTADDLALAEELADRAALALDNAVLFAQQRDAAVALQEELLSPAPQPDDLGIAVRYLPATAHAQVGGDWYDAFLQPDGSTVVAIGDVVGHDLHAAAGMGQLRSMLRALGYHSDDTPAQLLARADDALAGLEVGTMATALLGRVEQRPEDAARRERRVRWSSAGHLPPLLLHPGGRVEVLRTPSDLMLGLRPARPRHDHEAVLEAGSTLLLYTDGLVERRSRPLDEGVAALARILCSLDGAPLEELCDAVLEQALGGAHEDDVALLALRVHLQD